MVEADNQTGADNTSPTVRADIRGNTVPTTPVFDLVSTQIGFFEYDQAGAHGIGQTRAQNCARLAFQAERSCRLRNSPSIHSIAASTWWRVISRRRSSALVACRSESSMD